MTTTLILLATALLIYRAHCLRCMDCYRLGYGEGREYERAAKDMCRNDPLT